MHFPIKTVKTFAQLSGHAYESQFVSRYSWDAVHLQEAILGQEPCRDPAGLA